jgi:asparagine synthase (glutamine-hydrolysing)
VNVLAGVVALDREDGNVAALREAATTVVPAAPGAVTLGAAACLGSGDSVTVHRDAASLVVADLEPGGDPPGDGDRQPHDAAAIADLYRREGAQMFNRLDGGFAVAIWDERARTLLLAVDGFGIKRLYYSESRAGLAFASRASIAATTTRAREVDPTGVFLYLNFGFVPTPASVYKGVRRLPPGQVLTWRHGAASLSPYWDLQYPERPWSLPAAAARTYALLEASVARALQGSAPKASGAFLSGGTDSSTIVGLMSRLTRERVNAFSIGFTEDEYNELRYAEIAARAFDAAHYTAVLAPDEAFGALPRIVGAYDEPFGNDSTLPTFWCAKLARESGVNRLLAGDGGDELFGGNERYSVEQIFMMWHRLPHWSRRHLIEPALSALPARLWPVDLARRYVRRASIPNPHRFFSYGFFREEGGLETLAPEFVAGVDRSAPVRLLQAHFDRPPATSEMNRLLYLDMKLAIADADLQKVTRTAELTGIGVRFPMLDRALADFTGTLPVRFKVRGLEKRYLFKRAFGRLLPPEILKKPKHGFGLPVSHWLRTHSRFRDLARDTLQSTRCAERGYFRRAAIDRLFELQRVDTTSYYGGVLWSLLMLELWHLRHVDGL